MNGRTKKGDKQGNSMQKTHTRVIRGSSKGVKDRVLEKRNRGWRHTYKGRGRERIGRGERFENQKEGKKL